MFLKLVNLLNYCAPSSNLPPGGVFFFFLCLPAELVGPALACVHKTSRAKCESDQARSNDASLINNARVDVLEVFSWLSGSKSLHMLQVDVQLSSRKTCNLMEMRKTRSGFFFFFYVTGTLQSILGRRFRKKPPEPIRLL